MSRFNILPIDWNPITSTKTRFLETRSDGAGIYEHRHPGIHGHFLIVKDRQNWASTMTLEEARTRLELP
jgi:hypothetical protein